MKVPVLGKLPLTSKPLLKVQGWGTFHVPRLVTLPVNRLVPPPLSESEPLADISVVPKILKMLFLSCNVPQSSTTTFPFTVCVKLFTSRLVFADVEVPTTTRFPVIVELPDIVFVLEAVFKLPPTTRFL